MGITGLIPFLEKASVELNLKQIRGSTVAIDTYCWLHKGVFSCADKLARGEDTDLYVQYCLKYVNMLLSHDIKPILVFDGQHLPAKALTEKRRRENRQQSKKRAAELLRLGRVEEARSQMRRCVDVTHEMALRLIKECRLRNIDCIVAPYEADAQMAWLSQAGLAEYVVTEDSDLTLFGAQKIIFKLDLNGCGLLVEAKKLHLAMGCREEKYHFDKFRRMCILSGCDYLDSLPGIGLAKACKFMLKTEQDDMRLALKKIPQYLNMRNLKVDDEYIENFLKAEATFKHMYIYNPLTRRMERLNALTEHETDERYCSNAGSLLADSEQALHLALGNLNPFTLKRLDDWHPERASDFSSLPAKAVKCAKHKSIWKTNHSAPPAIENKSDQVDCALYFKKVDFTSQIINTELDMNQRLERAKQTEAEVFCLYNSGTKRKRKSSSSSGDDEAPSSRESPAQTKSRHNPFAKEQKASPVCENGSLLKILSPKKLDPTAADVGPLARSIKRSIYAKKQVEVRSRFFATQPTKQSSEAIETALTELPVELEKECHSPSKIKRLENTIESNNSAPDVDNVVLLSSDDSTESTTLLSSQETNSSTHSSSSLKLQQYQPQRSRRLGLSKPKPSKTSTFIKTTSNLNQINQPKLSMFGFQKRPVLK
ncbi:exonuclease 1 [Scaptodrosophila lebanonensis]|uniref:Exonuclease 1 n=1 Tax=Drosophila lebanonensis TaxID=7225 RepID=A0A6J2U7V3_DROLE|nr:exonuclease 1 [Scaptodrosophila lebanonensis]